MGEFANYIKTLAKCENVEFTREKLEGAIRDVSENLESFVPLAGVDTSAMTARLNSQKIKLEKEIEKLSNMLNNEKFVASAPANVVEANREALAVAQEKFNKIRDELVALGGQD